MPLDAPDLLKERSRFYRGTAGLMALDLGRDPHSGILLAACGDAHISNFGFYASPERQLVFDLNDFDEAAVAPWEWDLKRLITSVIVGGREAGYDERDVEIIARRVFAQYIVVLRRLVQLSPAERYFMHLNVESARRRSSRDGRGVLNAALAAAERRTSGRAIRQVKEAGESVLSQYGRIPHPARVTEGVAGHGEGFRAVGLQRVLQAVSDPFLGHLQANGRAFYVRQFHDMKGAVELGGLPLDAYSDNVISCAGLLGRAHAQSPTAGQVLGYVGTSDAASQAIVNWSVAYADQSLREFEAARAVAW